MRTTTGVRRRRYDHMVSGRGAIYVVAVALGLTLTTAPFWITRAVNRSPVLIAPHGAAAPLQVTK